MNKKIELYIHIPFCVKKCNYCDFLSGVFEKETKDRYVKRLIEELESKSIWADGYSVVSVFFGGGTPSLLEGEDIKAVMNTIRAHYHLSEQAEISLEANPGTIKADWLAVYHQAGINRLSLGLQSCHQKELNELGRIHKAEDFFESFQIARSTGFKNINVDLMWGLPGQTIESWLKSLKTVLKVEPEHISAYSLIIEEGTPFYKKYYNDMIKREKGELPQFLPDEETEREMYYVAKEMLKRNGYNQYEISNYAKKGFECLHNTGYWTGISYLGFGLGASSYFEESRFSNTIEMKEYLEGDFSKKNMIWLTKEEQMEEFMFLGLRLLNGIDTKEFAKRFKTDVHHIFGEPVKQLIRKELLIEENGRLFLSDKGIDVSNYVLAEFIL